MSTGNSWLTRQRKGDLVDLAVILQIKEYVLLPRCTTTTWLSFAFYFLACFFIFE